MSNLWPTPRAVDAVVRHSWPWVQKRMLEGRDVDLTTMVRYEEQIQKCATLNPDWVELLMGFPPGWTAPKSARAEPGSL